MMRVGAMVIGILFAIWTFFEALIVYGLSNASDDSKTSTAGAIALIAAIFAGVAASLVLAVPLFSAIIFGMAGLASFTAANEGYGNHSFYGIVFIALGIMAFFGWIGKKKERQERLAELNRQNLRDERIESLLRQQRDQVRYPTETPSPKKVTFPNFCPSCKHRNDDGVKYCAECGTSLTPTPAVTPRS